MKMKTTTQKIIDKAATFALKGNANSTTCATIYQPKVPKDLKKFSRLENDR